ncbi:MAG: hypothetical protein EU531_06435 [Promethearchaeota archaeon]|nr:MAG: hypothetical protein EU531_06435 [Candidatus Lokiarchaeota archaeon]
MTKHYKNEGIMKLLTVLGAVVGLITLILGLARIENYGFIDPVFGLDIVLNFIVGLVVVVLTFLVALKPNKPLPFHWLVLLILAILLVLFGAGIWACVLVIIAALIGLIEDL